MKPHHWLLLTALVSSLLLACGDDGSGTIETPANCHFQSGRPCPPGQLCLATQGNECNYVACTDSGIVGTAVGCQTGAVAPVTGGPFLCDPAAVSIDPAGNFTPPPGPCPLGALYSLDPNRAIPFLECVPADQCRPIACDPTYGGDGCPSGHTCSESSRTCLPLLTSL